MRECYLTACMLHGEESPDCGRLYPRWIRSEMMLRQWCARCDYQLDDEDIAANVDRWSR